MTNQGWINLTKLWKDYGSLPNKQPFLWLKSDEALNLQKTIEANSGIFLQYKSYRGKKGGTYAIEKLAKVYESFLTRTNKPNCMIEKEIRDKLWKELGGEREVNTDFGRIDLLTKDYLIEVKKANDWKDGVGQLLAYAKYYPNHKKRLHLWSSLDNSKFFHKAFSFCSNLEIQVTFE